MKTRAALEAVDARAIVDAAEREAAANGWNVSIAVVDDGGHLMYLRRLDGAGAATTRIAAAKANTSALTRRESKFYEDVINGPRQAFLSAPGLEGMLEGGVPLMKDGDCIGAVGVSGVAPGQDAQIARAGAAALAL